MCNCSSSNESRVNIELVFYDCYNFRNARALNTIGITMEVSQHDYGFLRSPWSTVHCIEAEPQISKVLHLLNDDVDVSPIIATKASLLSALLCIADRDDLFPINCNLIALRFTKIQLSQHEQQVWCSQPYRVSNRTTFSHYNTMCNDENVMRIIEPKHIKFIRRNVFPSPEELEMASCVMKSINSRESWPVQRTIIVSNEICFGRQRGKCQEKEIEDWKARTENRARARAKRLQEIELHEKSKRSRLCIEKQQIARRYRERKQRVIRWTDDPYVI